MKTRLLIVDDDQDHQGLLMLNVLGAAASAEIAFAGSACEFHKAVREQEFDCIILDFYLGDVRADDLLRESACEIEGTPVIIVSSCREQGVAIASFRQGICDFLPKEQALAGPQLWETISNAIDKGQRHGQERRLASRRERTLRRMAETDPLTSLLNRRGVASWIGSARVRHDRRANTACVMIDIDHFKHINDTYGHAGGDQVLKGLATMLTHCADAADLKVRYGGEEFLVIRQSCDLTETWSWAERFRRTVEAMTFDISDHLPDIDGKVRTHKVRITISAGVAVSPTSEVGEELITLADHALYLAKDTGRNRVCTWDMVRCRRLAEAIGPQAVGGPEQARRRFLEAVASRLGPVQAEHLTHHCECVADLAGRTARRLNCPCSPQQVRLAGLLHDIGKCAVPEELLAQNSALRPDQTLLMNVHAEEGAAIAQSLGFDEVVVDAIRHHHRWNLQPSECGDAADIIAVADALVAMTTDRPYRAALPMAAAVEEIRRQRGVQFEPKAAQAVIEEALATA